MSGLAKLPFIQEGTIAANNEETLYVKDDLVQGLRKPAGTGYIINDGPGFITVQCSDDEDGLSHLSTLYVTEHLVFEREDDVEVKTIHLTTGAVAATYRSRFARIRE